MIEVNKICEILQGIDIDSTFDANGWWETSHGVSFGKERLKELLDYIELEKNDIGLKDINGKSIYADSSIVEFDYKYLSGLVEKCIGCFIYDKKQLLYTIKLVGTPSENCIDYLKSSMSNFKIIDTIQENKLGLIKLKN